MLWGHELRAHLETNSLHRVLVCAFARGRHGGPCFDRLQRGAHHWWIAPPFGETFGNGCEQSGPERRGVPSSDRPRSARTFWTGTTSRATINNIVPSSGWTWFRTSWNRLGRERSRIRSSANRLKHSGRRSLLPGNVYVQSDAAGPSSALWNRSGRSKSKTCSSTQRFKHPGTSSLPQAKMDL